MPADKFIFSRYFCEKRYWKVTKKDDAFYKIIDLKKSIYKNFYRFFNSETINLFSTEKKLDS